MLRSWYSQQEEAKAKVEAYRAEAALAALTRAQAQPFSAYLLQLLRTLAKRLRSTRRMQGQPKQLGSWEVIREGDAHQGIQQK